ncbi:MAG: hypothetical protein ACYTDW_09285 [Planctomycetota bacterium]
MSRRRRLSIGSLGRPATRPTTDPKARAANAASVFVFLVGGVRGGRDQLRREPRDRTRGRRGDRYPHGRSLVNLA